MDFPRESLGILGDDEGDNEDYRSRSFEVNIKYLATINEVTVGKKLLARKAKYIFNSKVQQNRSSNIKTPDVPARKHKSLRSLNQSETESLLETDGSILQDQTNVGPPRRPSRRSDSILADTAFLTETHQDNSNYL